MTPPAEAGPAPGPGRKVTTATLREMKATGRRIVALTAYDRTFAALLDEAGVDIVLVGDSVATVVQGEETTVPVTLDQMVYHTRLAARGVRRALLVADLPFLSYQISDEDALRSAGRLLQEAHAEAVKLEGGGAMVGRVRRLTEAGIPVMGHLGLTPQSIHAFGSYAVRGQGAEAARLLEDARALEAAGAFALVLEKVPSALAAQVRDALAIPTIGIGAGPSCDGQILVSYDMLGLFERFRPRFVRRYAELAQEIRAAVQGFAGDVRSGGFPSADESY